jgi:ATP-dependent RNA helicase DHX36
MLGCVDPMLTVAAAAGCRAPFILPNRNMSRSAGQAALNKVKVQLAGGRLSDHLSLIGAYNHWQAAGGSSGQRQFCRRNFLSEATMRHIFGLRKQLKQTVVKLGCVCFSLSLSLSFTRSFN